MKALILYYCSFNRTCNGIKQDTTLYNKAFEKNIVIVTPATLLATLRTIDSMWANQKQQENAFEIARQVRYMINLRVLLVI
jgi:DNA anti-recombination protein RmuC